MEIENVFGSPIGNMRTQVSEKSAALSKLIFDNATNLTHKEIVVAMKLALEDIEARLVLLSPPVPVIDN